MHTDQLQEITEAYIKEHKTEILEALKALVKIPSVRGEAEKGAPFGRACRDVLLAVKKLYRNNGFQIETEKPEYVLASHGDGEKTIGLFTHADVVPADGEWLFGAPFKAEEKDGLLVGRGVNDDKSGVVESLYAAKLIRDMKLPLLNKLLLFTGANEESGMQDITAFARGEVMPDVSLVADGGYPFCSGEKGRACFWLTSPEQFTEILNFEGGKSHNIVLDSAKACIRYNDTLFKEIEEKALDGFVVSGEGDEIQISAHGLSEHAAYPEGSKNAAKMLASFLASLNALCACDREILTKAANYLSGYYGEGLGIACEDDVFGKLTASNGIVKVQNGKLMLSFDVRFGLCISGKEVLEKTEKTTNWELTECEVSDGYNIEGSHPFAAALSRAYKKATGLKEAEGGKMPGATYARHLKNAFPVGTAAYHDTPKPDFPDGHGGCHQPDEVISVDGLLDAIKILVYMILEIDTVL